MSNDFIIERNIFFIINLTLSCSLYPIIIIIKYLLIIIKYFYIYSRKEKNCSVMCTVRKIPNLLTRIKKHSLLNSSRSPAVTELFANVNVNDKRVSRQKRAVNAFEPPVEKHRVVFTGRAFWTIQRSGLVFFLLFSPLFSFFHSTPPHPFGQSSWRGAQRRRTTGTLYFHHPRRDRSICFAAGIACLAATSFLSYLLCVPSPFLPFPVRWLTRTPYGRFDRWTNRPVVISTYPQVHA